MLGGDGIHLLKLLLRIKNRRSEFGICFQISIDSIYITNDTHTRKIRLCSRWHLMIMYFVLSYPILDYHPVILFTIHRIVKITWVCCWKSFPKIYANFLCLRSYNMLWMCERVRAVFRGIFIIHFCKGLLCRIVILLD